MSSGSCLCFLNLQSACEVFICQYLYVYIFCLRVFSKAVESHQNTQQVLNNDRWELVHKSPYSPFRWDNSEACGSHNFSELPLRIKIQLPRRKWLDKTTFIFCFPFLVSLSYWGSVGSFPK